MRLKRGIERESCDFCHRRKIKCDRSSRMEKGHDSCSQCSLRQLACRLDDSDDVRIRNKRRQTNATESDAHASCTQPGSTSLPGTPSLVLSQENTPAVSLHAPEAPRDDSPLEFPFLDDPFELSPDAIFFLDQIFMVEPTLPDSNIEPAASLNA